MEKSRMTILSIIILSLMVIFLNVGCHIGSKDCEGPGPTLCLWCGEKMCMFDEADKVMYKGVTNAIYNKDYKVVLYNYKFKNNNKFVVVSYDCIALEEVYDLSLEIFIKSNGNIIGNKKVNNVSPKCQIVKNLDDDVPSIRAYTGDVEIELYNYKSGEIEIFFDYVSAYKE